MKNSISKKTLREFGLLLGLGIPLFFGLFLAKFRGHEFQIWTIWIGIIFLNFAIFTPKFLLYPYRGWMFIGYILGLINSRIILGGVFIFVLMPISFLMKTIGYDPLRKKKNISKDTYKEQKKDHIIDLNRVF